MRELNAEGEAALRALAERHAIGLDAVRILFEALVAGQGSQAQFNHPELGGMGQWSQGGMIMIGDMFNTGLKAKIAAVCADLAGLVRGMAPEMTASSHQSQTQGTGREAPLQTAGAVRSWWPQELGQPASTGAQNSLRYAFFPLSHRMAIDQAGKIAVYDTKDHRITGFSQQQGGDQSITFTSQHGLVQVAELAPVAAPGGGSDTVTGDAARPGAGSEAGKVSAPQAPAPKAASGEHDLLEMIERLSGLHARGVLTEDEYRAKKAELLARL